MPANFPSSLRTILGLGCTAACLLSTSAMADYRAQVELQHDSVRFIGGGDPKQDVFLAEATYYLQDVSEDNSLPYSTLAFTGRATSVFVGRAEARGFADAAATGIGGRWVQSDSGFIAELGYAQGDSDTADIASIGVGMYVAKNQAVVASYREIDAEVDGADQDFIELRYNGVLDAAEGHTELGLALSYSDDNDDNEFTWQGDVTYYPVRNLGFGLTVGEVLSDLGGETDILGLQVEMFPVSAVAVMFGYEVLGLDGSEDFDDVKSFSVGVTGRF